MPLAATVRLDFIDAKGKTSFTKVRIPTGFALADYTQFGFGIAQSIANISDCRITNVSFCLGIDLSGATIKAAASVLSDIAQKAIVGFGTAVSGFRTLMKIPAIVESKIVLGSDTVDQTDADWAAFLTAMEDGIVVTGGTISPCDIRENDVTTTEYAREFFRKK